MGCVTLNLSHALADFVAVALETVAADAREIAIALRDEGAPVYAEEEELRATDLERVAKIIWEQLDV